MFLVFTFIYSTEWPHTSRFLLHVPRGTVCRTWGVFAWAREQCAGMASDSLGTAERRNDLLLRGLSFYRNTGTPERVALRGMPFYRNAGTDWSQSHVLLLELRNGLLSEACHSVGTPERRNRLVSEPCPVFVFLACFIPVFWRLFPQIFIFKPYQFFVYFACFVVFWWLSFSGW